MDYKNERKKENIARKCGTKRRKNSRTEIRTCNEVSDNSRIER
jgi:hypothetical protein